MIVGTVIHGQKIGKKHGLPPTMNIRVAPAQSEFEKLEQGIYCVKVRLVTARERQWYCGVAHYGPRPAVNAPESFEIHLFDFDEDWYGASVEIEVKDYLRPIQNFETIDALRVQIEKDIEQGRVLAKM